MNWRCKLRQSRREQPLIEGRTPPYPPLPSVVHSGSTSNALGRPGFWHVGLRRTAVHPGRPRKGSYLDSTAAARQNHGWRYPTDCQSRHPGKPQQGKLDAGECDKCGQGLGKVLEVLGKPPVAAEPQKVRSTTQRRGSTTKPFTSSLRLTISRRSRGTLATAVQPAMRCSRHRPRSVRAMGTVGVSCRGRDRRRRGPGSQPNGQRPASETLRCRPRPGS